MVDSAHSRLSREAGRTGAPVPDGSRHVYSRRAWLGSAVAATLAGWAPRLSASPLGVPLVDMQARQEAIAAIPFDRLTEQAQEQIRGILQQPSIYRQMPTTLVEADPDLYVFLIRNPEVVVNMWDVMGVTSVQLQRVGDYVYAAQDGAGTTCHLELIYGDRTTHVMYGEGRYEGPLLRRLIQGRCVLVLQSAYRHTEDHATHITSRLDMFMQFDNAGAELLARSLHPLVGKSADHNFVESVRFLGQVSKAAETKSDKLQRFSERLTKVDANVRQQFVILTDTVARRAADRGLAQRSDDVPGERAFR